LKINLAPSGYNYAIFIYANNTSLPSTTISGFYFHPCVLDGQAGAIGIEGQGWSIHHNKCASNSSNDTCGVRFVFAIGANSNIEPAGLVDYNTVINGQLIIGDFTTFAKQGAIWNMVLDLGALGSSVYPYAKGMYIEGNTFTSTTAVKMNQQAIDANYSGKYIFPYNTLYNYNLNQHGLQDNTDRGPMSFEIYGNTFTTTHYDQSVITTQAGTGVVFNNLFTNGVDGEYIGYKVVKIGHRRVDYQST